MSRARARGRRRWHINAGIALREPYPVRLPEVARRRTLCGEDARLAALEAAPAGPVPVRGVAVLLPGFTGSKEDFIPLLPLIAAAGYRVICYDQRGQYESAARPRACLFHRVVRRRSARGDRRRRQRRPGAPCRAQLWWSGRQEPGDRRTGAGAEPGVAGFWPGGREPAAGPLAGPAHRDHPPVRAGVFGGPGGPGVPLDRCSGGPGCPGCATGSRARSVPAWWGCAWRCHASRIVSQSSHPRRSRFLSFLVKMMTFGLPRCRKRWLDVSMRPLP